MATNQHERRPGNPTDYGPVDDYDPRYRWQSLYVRVEARSESIYLPGVLAGLVGFVVFLLLHAVWIRPIWFVAPLGIVIAGIGGVAVGWAFADVKPSLPTGVIGRWIAVGIGAVLVLIPTMILVQLSDPYVPVVDGVVRTAAVDVTLLAVRFVVELIVVTAITGASVGWLLTHRRRSALAVSAASVALALGPGHNIPFFHLASQPTATWTSLLLLLAAIASASVVLVTVDRFFEVTRDR